MDDITMSEVDEAIWHAYLGRDPATVDMFLDLRLEMAAAPAPRPTPADVTASVRADLGVEWSVP
jgi:hypothetical protein